MTGHQPNPGMGRTAVGEPTVAVSISDICRALGAEFVEETDPYDLVSTEDVFRTCQRSQRYFCRNNKAAMCH